MVSAGRKLYEQGLACEKAADIPGAFEAFRLSAKADPRVAAPYMGLSRVLIHNHQRSEAIACLERAVDCEPSNPAVRVLLGQALTQDGQLEHARKSFQEALYLNYHSIDAVVGLAGVFEDLGKRKDAAETYGNLLERVPDEANCLAGLLGVAEGTVLEKTIQTAQSQLKNAAKQDAALMGYALGKVLARHGEHDAAFGAWSKANITQQKEAGPFDRDYFDRRIDRLIDIFSVDFFKARKGWGKQTDRPVFVVGLPRSGTTLTEQIIASHPSVFGAGELDVLTDMATGTPDRLGRPEPPWPETATELTQEIIDSVAREHLDRLAALAPMNALHIIDKQPLNFWHLGLVALTFPNARIVHCTRDIRDNGLSIFAENFTEAQRWSTDLSDIAYYWHGYCRLTAHWQNVTGLSFLEVNYEDTVASLEKQAHRLTDFLALPWDQSVLDFHETQRAVQTPSRWQVRRPLYSSSVNRWRHFEKHIAPLNQAFKDFSKK